MDVAVSSGTLEIGTLVFVFGLLTAVFATLEICNVTNFTERMKLPPVALLLVTIPIFISAPLSALGNGIAPIWGDLMPVIAFLFFIGATALVIHRSKPGDSHNRSSNRDAGKAGAG